MIKDLNHPNIIKAIEFIASDSWTYLVMEMAVGKELQRCEIKNVKSVIKQLLHAVEYLHKNNICHNDIKPENIIYDSSTQ